MAVNSKQIRANCVNIYYIAHKSARSSGRTALDWTGEEEKEGQNVHSNPVPFQTIYQRNERRK
jgi:hypothetical protein